jgi:hypothetical protein
MTQLQDGEIGFATASPFDLGAVAAAVAEHLRWLHGLRREADQILAAQRTATATPEDLHRYRTIRLALAFHASPARLPDLPTSTDEVLRRRRNLIVETLLATLDQEPPVAS